MRETCLHCIQGNERSKCGVQRVGRVPIALPACLDELPGLGVGRGGAADVHLQALQLLRLAVILQHPPGSKLHRGPPVGPHQQGGAALLPTQQPARPGVGWLAGRKQAQAES